MNHKEVSMKKQLAIALSALMLSCALNHTLAQVDSDRRASDPKPSTKVKQMPFRGKIVKVDPEKKIIALAGKERDRLFQITEQSRIRKEGQPLRLEDVKVGDTVGGLARADGSDGWEVVTLNVGEKLDASASKEAPQGGSAE
jgi:hypothetical protein